MILKILKFSNFDPNFLEISTMLSLTNGNFIINDFTEGWDLILLSPEFQELERLEGSNEIPPAYYKAIKTRTSED